MRCSGILLGMFLALAASFGAVAQAQQAVEHHETTQYHAPLPPGHRLVIRHSYGMVRLRPGAVGEVRVSAARNLVGINRQAIQAYLSDLKITVQPLEDRVEIHTDRPAGEQKLLTQTTVDLDVTVPAGTVVEVTNSFGNLDAQGIGGLQATAPFGDLTVNEIAGDVDLNGQYGKVTIADVRGNVTVTHSFGDVDVSRVGGALTVHNQFAQIRAQGVGKQANLASRSGPIVLNNVGGGAQVTCQRGQVTVSRVQGDLSVTNRDESITVADVQGVVVIDNSNGPVQAKRIAGELKIDNRFWTVDVEQVTGKVTVQHGNGAAQIKNVVGNAVITTSNGPLRVQGVRGTAVLTNSHGLIEVDGVHGDCSVHNEFASVSAQHVSGALEVFNAWGTVRADLPAAAPAKTPQPWVLQTSHGNAILGVPERVGCGLNVEVNSGTLESAFPLKIQRAGGRESAHAQLNGGGVPVEMRVDLGMAQIEKRPMPAPVKQPAKK